MVQRICEFSNQKVEYNIYRSPNAQCHHLQSKNAKNDNKNAASNIYGCQALVWTVNGPVFVAISFSGQSITYLKYLFSAAL